MVSSRADCRIPPGIDEVVKKRALGAVRKRIRLFRALSHGCPQKLFFPFGCKGEKGDTVVITSCTDFRKAVDECV